MICSAIGMMQQNRPFGNRQVPHGYQADVGTATLKTPPSWCYEQSGSYSLRSWLSDIVMWSTATDMEAERQGAAVALQISGVARELVREIPAQHLRDGIHENGQHIPGLMLLCRTLAQRFAPLETELQTKSMSELLGFVRMNHETIDACLTRFDVLRHRAMQRGGFILNVQSLSYVLLCGLRLRPEQWDRALIPTDGELPNNDAQFQQLMERLRRIGRMQEGHFNTPFKQGATGDLGGYHYFPSFNQSSPIPETGFGMDYQNCYGGSSSSFGQQPVMPDSPMPSFAASMDPSGFGALSETEEQCTRCGMYYEDEFSSSTDTDDGNSDSEVSQLYAHYSNDPEMLGNVLYGDYLVAKQRWRRYAGRPPRRYRRGHFNKYHQRNNFNRLQKHGKTFASFLPPNAFASHRGPGGKSAGKGAKGSKGRQNPRGIDGQVMKCHRCGSTEHLIRKCPKPDTGNPHVNNPNALAMLAAGPSNLQFYTKGSMPLENVQFSGASSVSSGSSNKRMNPMLNELESLRSVAHSRRRTETDAKAIDDGNEVDYSENPDPKFPPPPQPAPSLEEVQERNQSSSPTGVWTTFTTGSTMHPIATPSEAVSVSPSKATHVGDANEALLASLLRPASASVQSIEDRSDVQSHVSSASQSSRHVSKLVRQRQQQQAREATTLQLSELLGSMGQGSQPSSQTPPSFPWWEVNGILDPDNVRYLHSVRTTLCDGRIGLLVDPGAHDNLAGEITMRNLEAQLRTRARPKILDEPLSVPGEGKESQPSQHGLIC